MPTTTITAASLADNHHRSYHPLPTRDSRLLVLAKQRQRASSLNDAAPDAFRREIYLERIASPSRAQQLRSPQQQRRASIQPLMPLHATNIVPRRVAKCTACPSSPSPDEPGASTMHKASAISLPAAAAVATTHLTAATTLLAAVVMTTADHDRQDKEREEKWGHLTTTCLAQSKRVEKMAHELVTGDHHDETCVKELLRTQSEILTKLESLMVGPAPAVAEMDLPEETIQDTSSPTPGVEEDKTDNNTIIQPEMRRSQWWSISGASVDGKVIRRGADGKIMISGMGQTTEISLIPKHLVQYASITSATAAPFQFPYALRIEPEDRSARFEMLPRQHWTDDKAVSRCEFVLPHASQEDRCKAKFSWLVRRHHCRRCGHVFCDRHSTNRMLLFDANGKQNWSRLCDHCFFQIAGPSMYCPAPSER